MDDFIKIYGKLKSEKIDLPMIEIFPLDRTDDIDEYLGKVNNISDKAFNKLNKDIIIPLFKALAGFKNVFAMTVSLEKSLGSNSTLMKNIKSNIGAKSNPRT